MKKRRCIYCGGEDLSKSDVIPDALTNGKIINSCVCRIAHNNKFSDLFEAEVIKDLALFTNELDVKSSKGKGRYAAYEATIGIAGENYKTRLTSESELFKGNKIIKSVDETHLLGPIDEIRKIKQAEEKDIEIIDLNEQIIEKGVGIDTSVFFSQAMYRMVSKIAFEWYCLKNQIEDKMSVFDDAIAYITTGQSKAEIVNLVSNEELYYSLNDIAGFGSHVLLTYIDNDQYVHVLVDLFGIAIYDVRICKKNIDCEYNAMFHMITLDADQKFFAYKDLNDAVKKFNESFTEENLGIGGLKIKVPVDLTDYSLNEKMQYIILYEGLISRLNLTRSTEKMMPILLDNIKDILQTSALTIRGLRRFIKEHREYIDSKCGLNPNATYKKDIFLFYILYVVGKNEKLTSLVEVNSSLRGTLGEGEIQITDAFAQELLNDIINDDGYKEFLVLGADRILDWKV